MKRIRRLLYPRAPAGIWAPLAATVIFVVTAAVSFAAWQPKSAQSAPIRAQAQASGANNIQVKTFYLTNSETPGDMDKIVTALRQVLASQRVQAVYAQKAIVVRDSPERLSVAGTIIDVEENQTVSPDRAARLKLQVKTLENLLGQHRLGEAQGLRNAIVEENGDTAQPVQNEVTETGPYSKWLKEDVVYIISDEERDTFLHLNTDEERAQFIKAFWERRDPTPGSADNKFKDEHYRRIAYSNEHFTTPSGKGGWQTDRGHIYIVYGAPDARDHFLAGENGNQFASEKWHYNHIEGVGDNLMFEFVDRGGIGDFVLAPSPSSQVAPKSGASNASAAPGENATQGVTILSPTEGVNFAPYITEMLKSVQTHWYKAMPQEAMEGRAGQVSVIFSIQPDGRLGEAQVDSSSGVTSFDEAAIDAVRGSSPLQPLPKEFHGPYLRLKITFVYNRQLHS